MRSFAHNDTLTIEHLRWFALKAEKKVFGTAHWAIYSCLAVDCAIGGSPRIFTSYSRLAARLHCSRNSIPALLKDLSEAGLLKIGQSGEIELLNPEPDWLNKCRKGATTVQSQTSPNYSRAQKVAGAGKDTPPKGVSTSQRQQPNPDLPPPPKTQAKALNA